MPAAGRILYQDNATDGKTPLRVIASDDLVFALNGHQNLSPWGRMRRVAFPIGGRPQPVASFRWSKSCEMQRLRRRRCEAGDQIQVQILESGYALLIGK